METSADRILNLLDGINSVHITASLIVHLRHLVNRKRGGILSVDGLRDVTAGNPEYKKISRKICS